MSSLLFLEEGRINPHSVLMHVAATDTSSREAFHETIRQLGVNARVISWHKRVIVMPNGSTVYFRKNEDADLYAMQGQFFDAIALGNNVGEGKVLKSLPRRRLFQ